MKLRHRSYAGLLSGCYSLLVLFPLQPKPIYAGYWGAIMDKSAMKTEIEGQEITMLEFARMWGTYGVVPDSSKTMLLIADYEKERAEIAELNRIHALPSTSPAKAAHRVPRLKAMMIAVKKRGKTQ